MGTKFRWQLTSGVLAAVTILFFAFIPVFADEEYPIWIGEENVTSSVTSGDGWFYEGDETGGTLTLMNANISDDPYKDIYQGIITSVPLKIVLVGDNKISDVLCGINSTSQLTIVGDGSLEVSGTHSAIYANGLTINGTRITATSDDVAIKNQKWNECRILNSTVVCDGKGSGIDANECLITITNSKVNAHGGNYGIYTTEIKAEDGSTVVAESDNSIAIVAPTGLTSNNSDVTARGKTQGVDTLGLVLNGGKFRASGSELAVSRNNYRITLGDEMHIVSPENGSIKSYNEGYNKLYYFANSDGSIATDVYVRESKVKAVTNGQKDLVAIDKPLADEGDTVTVTVNNTFYYIVKNITANDSAGQTIKVQDKGNGIYTFTMPAKDVTVNIEFGHPDKYPVWIGEHQVTGENDSGEGWSCKVDDIGATLTLNGINLEYNSDALKSDLDLTIVLKGDNSLNTSANGGNSINANSSLTIKGDGSLSLKGTLKGKSDITISDKANIEITDSENGIMTTGVLTIDNSAVDIKGKTNAIYVNGGTVNITNSTVNCTTQDNYCIYTGTVTVNRSNVSAQGKYGIFAKTFTADNGSSLSVDCDSNGATGEDFVSGNSKIDITVQNEIALDFNEIELLSGTVSLKSTRFAIFSKNGIKLGENMKITVPEDGQFSSDGMTIADGNGRYAKEVLIRGTFHVNIDGHNRVRIDKTDFAPGETVDFSIWDDDMYAAFRDLKVTDMNGDPIAVTDNGDRKYSFTMPESSVTLLASFEDAEMYNISIKGINLTSFGTSGEGWKYDGDNTGGTLYLENAKITDDYGAIYTNIPLTIVLKGDNVVEQTSSGFAIYSSPAITIKGSGSLTIKSYTGAIYANGITICEGATVKTDGMYGLNSNGAGMSITDSKVFVNSYSEAALSDNNGSVNSIVIKNSTVECSSYNNNILTKALTIENSTVECSSDNYAMNNLSVLTIDNSTVKASGVCGINVSKTLSVLNGSDLTVNAKYDGIRGGSLSFSNSNVHVESENAYAVTANGIDIDGGSVYAKSPYVAFKNYSNKISLSENMVLLIPENGKLNDEENDILDSEGATAKEVLIKQNYKVTVTAGDNGTATASVQSGLEGTEVTLTATPDEGCFFKEWQVVKGGITISDTGSETATFTIGTADVEVKAIFEAKPTPSPEPTAIPTTAPTTTPVPTAAPTSAAKPTAVPSASPTSAAKPTVKPTTAPTQAAEPTKASTATLKLNKTKADLVSGKNLTLKATLKGSSDKITWKTSDKKVATVDANGKVTAKMAGQATITASAAGKTATCTITVLYKDVTNTKDFWYAPTNYLTAKGVVKGYANQTEFRPANVCTRAQMVTFIWRLQGEPKPKTTACKFKDVKKTDYFYKACIWGNENHIVEGYKDGTFGPQIVCARKHAVTFLWRLAGKPAPASKTNKFKDVKKSDYFYTATLWASEKGILAGYSDGTFKPDGDCLRRQMVTFLFKYDKFINLK